jgi:hypothetical protein
MRLLPRTKISPGESQEKALGSKILPDSRGGEGSAKMRPNLTVYQPRRPSRPVNLTRFGETVNQIDLSSAETNRIFHQLNYQCNVNAVVSNGSTQH